MSRLRLEITSVFATAGRRQIFKEGIRGRSLTESWFTSLLVFMKATIEIDDELYRRVKAAAALRGRKVKDLVAEGLRTVLRSSHTGLRTRRIQLPIVKSKKPGTLRLSNEMIAEAEARLDTGHES